MRTPEEIFKLLIGFIEDGATSLALLAAWRDECVDEKDAIIRARDALVGMLTAERDAAMRSEAEVVPGFRNWLVRCKSCKAKTESRPKAPDVKRLWNRRAKGETK